MHVIKTAFQELAPSVRYRLPATETQHALPTRESSRPSQHVPDQPFPLLPPTMTLNPENSSLPLSALSINLIIEIICSISLLQCKKMERWAASLGINYYQHTTLSLLF